MAELAKACAFHSRLSVSGRSQVAIQLSVRNFFNLASVVLFVTLSSRFTYLNTTLQQRHNVKIYSKVAVKKVTAVKCVLIERIKFLFSTLSFLLLHIVKIYQSK